MFPTSSQRKYWTFVGETELNRLRSDSNRKFIEVFGKNIQKSNKEACFLNPQDEKTLLRHYEYALKQFCSQFKPPMPKYVVGTSMAFLKRFYLYESVMNYHPKDIMLTCVYLACKVEEFNVSIMQFVSNLKGDKEKIADLILSHELLVMHGLHYHLTVHNPFRPVEGFYIDIKTRCPDVGDVEKLRKGTDDFIDRTLNTDACLVFSPSQIALAGILSSASKAGMNLDSYVTDTLLEGGNKDKLTKTIEQIKRVRYMVKHTPSLNREEVRAIEQKLDKCRNQENNPHSEVYKRKMEEMLEGEEEYQTKKRKKIAEKEKKEERELLGL